jgi:NAD(P)H-dependent FMN reductase
VSQVRERNESAYAAFRNRVFSLGAASPEPHGGVRGLMALRQILELGCGALVLPEQIAIPQADQAFDERDNLSQASLANQLRVQLARLVDVARMMM